MDLNIREMLEGTPSRLRYVFRYSTSRVGAPESVAEHSYYVALYAFLIGRWVVENTNEFVGMELLLSRAILHDLEEARSGDFPRSFKHSNEEMRKLLERASDEAFMQIVEGLIPATGDKGQVGFEMIMMWRESKNHSTEGRILELCDFLSVLSFMMQEGAAGGNHIIQRHVVDMDLYFNKFLHPEYEFLRPIVDAAAKIMAETF